MTVLQEPMLRESLGARAAAVPAAETCDGVVCFAAVDWWYHNRGHSECQIMRRLAKRVPVLWINSIGMRAPSPGKSDLVLRRYTRKLRSTMKGLQQQDSSLWVYSPVFIPRYTDGMVTLNGRLLDAQIAVLLRRLGIRRPAAWVTVPTAAGAVERRAWSRVLFNRSDDFAAFPEVDRGFVERLERRLLARADDVLYVNRALQERERHLVRAGHYVGHGVDFDHFASARPIDGPTVAPAALGDLPRPIIGFYGALDGYTVDLPLLIRVARAFPRATLLVIGPKQMDIAALEAEPNVRYVGPIPYQELPRYAACFDAALMPWLRNEWIDGCNPIKLKEYLALGMPVASVRFRELLPYESLVYAAETHEEFLAQVARALADGDRALVQRRRQAVAPDSWDAIAAQVAGLVGLSDNRVDEGGVAGRKEAPFSSASGNIRTH
jgi:hypothetical protein